MSKQQAFRAMHQQGLTFLELLVAVGLLGVIAGFAFPGLERLASRIAVRVTHDQVVLGLARARAHAVATARPVSVCPSADGHACRGDGIWDAGWIAFVDADGDRRRDAGETLLERAPPAPSGVTVRSSRFRSRVLFSPSGMAFGSNLTVRTCPARGGADGLAAVMSNPGRVRSRRESACPASS